MVPSQELCGWSLLDGTALCRWAVLEGRQELVHTGFRAWLAKDWNLAFFIAAVVAIVPILLSGISWVIWHCIWGKNKK